MKKEHLLIFGGTGFIGTHLAKIALKKGWKITSVSKKKPITNRIVSGVNYLFLDITNYKNLKKKINGNFTHIVNLSGYANNNYNSSKACLNAHFIGTVNIVKRFLKNKKIKKFIHAGSSSEYGNIAGPQKENDICNPNNYYGKSKLITTKYLQLINKKYKFPVTILRFFSVYGPLQSLDRAIPQIINGCLSGKKFKVTKGIQLRDFSYIEDIVNVILKSLKANNINGKVINVGSGKPIKVKNIVEMIKKITGKGKPQFGKIKYSKFDNMRLFPSIKIAKKYLDLKNNFPLKRGIEITIKSFL